MEQLNCIKTGFLQYKIWKYYYLYD